MADKEETEKTIAEDLVVTKYKMAGEIVNRKKTVACARAEGRAATSAHCARVSCRRGHMECGAPMPGYDHVLDPTSLALSVHDSVSPFVSVLLLAEHGDLPRSDLD